MELRKNQSKWNIVDMSEEDLIRLTNAINHYNHSHVQVGRRDVFTSINVSDVEIIPESWDREALQKNKVFIYPKDVEF